LFVNLDGAAHLFVHVLDEHIARYRVAFADAMRETNFVSRSIAAHSQKSPRPVFGALILHDNLRSLEKRCAFNSPAMTSDKSQFTLFARRHQAVWRPLRWILLVCFTATGVEAQEYVAKDLYVLTLPAGSGQGLSFSAQGAIALGQSVGSTGSGTYHALIWFPPTGDVVDVHPSFFTSSTVNATDGDQQVGSGYTASSAIHAALWNGTLDSAVDLHPPNLVGLDNSIAYGVLGGQQVGIGSGIGTGNDQHALLWKGSPDSALDMNPPGFVSSAAYGTDGEHQVGIGATATTFGHALLWAGTASSAIDLHKDALPTGFFNVSTAIGVGGGQQVGQIASTGIPGIGHAALWSGTAESEVDLNPADAINSIALATNGKIQVGQAVGGPPAIEQHARLWKGTADSAVDLHDFLPDGFTESAAYSIDAAGNIYGLASNDSDGTIHAIEWLTQAARLSNISTRADVGTGDSVLIAGFIVSGTQAKPILIRGLGPSLANSNVPFVLADPILELHDSTGTIILSNDDWKDTQRDAIEATGLAPTDDAEAVVVAQAVPGAYTIILRGVDEGVGNGLLELYDLDSSLDSRLLNLSSRGRVLTGDSAMIGGFIVEGAESGDILIRAIGPSLTQFGIADALSDPLLELHDKDGLLIVSNDDWKETQQAQIEATGLAPTDDRESAILATLSPDSYTAIVRGKNDTTGVALVEVYNISP